MSVATMVDRKRSRGRPKETKRSRVLHFTQAIRVLEGYLGLREGEISERTFRKWITTRRNDPQGKKGIAYNVSPGGMYWWTPAMLREIADNMKENG